MCYAKKDCMVIVDYVKRIFDNCQDVEKECLMTVRMWKKNV